MNILFDSKDKNNLINYFKFKEKNNYSFSKDELNCFITSAKNKILSLNDNQLFNTIILPETSNLNLIKLAHEVAINVTYIYKNNKNDIILELHKQSYQKKEKESLLNSISNMKTIKMAEIKGNQRYRFIDILFKEPNIQESLFINSLFLDDSSFSSYTYQAAKKHLKKIEQSVILFSK